MLTREPAHRRSGRNRLLWSLVLSASINVCGAVVLAPLLLPVHVESGGRNEVLTVSRSVLRIERRAPSHASSTAKPAVPRIVPSPKIVAAVASVTPKSIEPRKRSTPKIKQRVQKALIAKRSSPHSRIRMRPIPIPASPSLSAPRGWAKQDYGNIAENGVTLWLDWHHQTARFVPRLLLWQRRVELDAPDPSLDGAVGDVLDTLQREGDKVYASRAEAACNGTRPGWFISYEKLYDDPPMRYEEALFVFGKTVYRATYVRPADLPEDRDAREALRTLC